MVGSVASAVAGPIIGGIFGGSQSPEAPTLSTYQYPNMNEFATDFQTLINQNMANNPAATYAPQAKDIFSSLYNNTATAGYKTAGANAGTAAGDLAALDKSNANLLSNTGAGLIGGGNTVMNLGLDPQKELYKRTLQQLQDQVRVGQAARGITMSPYGAGLENQALGNFNIDWDNQQLNRAIAGLGAAGLADTRGGELATQAGNLGQQGVSSTLAAGNIPYSVNQGVGTDQQNSLVNLINTLTGANTSNEMSIADILSYLGSGSGQANAMAGLAGKNYQNQLTQAQNAGMGLSNLITTGINAIPSFGGSSFNPLGLSSGSNFSSSDLSKLASSFDLGEFGF